MNATMRKDSSYLKGVSYQMGVVPSFKLLMLIIIFLVSSFGLIYIKEINRQLLSTFHYLQQEEYILQMSSNRLLEKRSVLNAQIKVQDQAQVEFNMELPKEIVRVEI